MLKVMNRLPERLERIKKGAEAGITKACDFMKEEAQRDVPVDTGSLKASIYEVTSLKDTYDENVAEAEALNPKLKVMPKVSPEQEEGVASGVVGVAAYHGQFIEYGTSRMSAQPFFHQAALTTQQKLAEILRASIK